MRCLDANSFRLKPLAVLVFLAGCCFMTAKAQQPLPPPPLPRAPVSPGQSPNPTDNNNGDTMAHRAMVQQAQRRNDQRQQDIVNDTAKLLSLAEQLKAEMEKSSKNQMSVSEIKKAEEIEKLAKAVKEKMKGS
jgi:flagellar motility protein MotE (MotC chaperone)